MKYRHCHFLGLVCLLVHLFIAAAAPEELCNDFCTRNLTKKNFYGKTLQRSCFCDECDEYADCCSDVASTPSLGIPQECNVRVSAEEHVYSVSKCPVTWPEPKTRVLCERPDDDPAANILKYVPVYNSQTSRTYRNIFCAQCNIAKLTASTLQFFQFQSLTHNKLNVAASSNDTAIAEVTLQMIDEFLQSRRGQQENALDFEFTFKEPESLSKPLRRCVRTVDTCPPGATDSSAEAVVLCATSPTAMRYVSIRNEIFFYKNKHCATCNGINASVTKVRCTHVVIPGRTDAAYKQGLQLLFDLSDLYGELVVKFTVKVSSAEANVTLTQSCGEASSTSTSANETSLSGMACAARMLNSRSLPPPMAAANCSIDEPMTLADTIKTYATIVGQFISIVSLLILLTIYAVNKALRTMPGQILISLCLSLLGSQVAFLLATYVAESAFTRCDPPSAAIMGQSALILQMLTPCYLLSVATHYCNLCFFLWSNVMAYDFYRIFTKMMAPQNEASSQRRLFRRYSTYAWLVSSLFILALLSHQFIAGRLVYGFRLCFISTQLDRLVYFVLPVATILLVNIYFAIRAILAIRAIDKMTKSFQEGHHDTTPSSKKPAPNSDKQRFALFVKLFLLTGMTWVTGVLSSVFAHSLVWYVYIGLNSLQGLFILCAFAFNPQTRREMRSSGIYKRLESILTTTTSPFGRRSSERKESNTVSTYVPKPNAK